MSSSSSIWGMSVIKMMCCICANLGSEGKCTLEGVTPEVQNEREAAGVCDQAAYQWYEGEQLFRAEGRSVLSKERSTWGFIQ